MPAPIGRGDVQALIDEGALLIDVLDPTEFAHSHLPGAHNVPAAGLVPERLDALICDQPIVVYSRDLQCDLSARSARLLEHYGFRAVHDYEPGKADWLAYGLPFDGDGGVSVASLLEPCPRACHDDTVAEVDARLAGGAAEDLVVVDHGDIVLGLVRRSALADAPRGDLVAAHMVPNPSTFRPTTHPAELSVWLEARGATEALVTTASGRLLGRVTGARLREAGLLGEGRPLLEASGPGPR